MKETKPYDLPKEGPKNKVSEPDSKEYILTGLKEAFLEMKEVKARRSQSRPAEELLKELMEERDSHRIILINETKPCGVPVGLFVYFWRG